MLEFPRWACPLGRPHVIVNNQAELDAVMATALPEPALTVNKAERFVAQVVADAPKRRGRKRTA